MLAQTRLRWANLLECGERNRRPRDNKSLNRSDISRRGRLIPWMVGYRRFYHPLHSQIQTFPVARLTRALSRLRSVALGHDRPMLERARQTGFGGGLPNLCMSGLKHDRMQRAMLSALRFGCRSNGAIRSTTPPHKRTLHFPPLQHLLRPLCTGHVASLHAFRGLHGRSVVTGTYAPASLRSP